MPVVKLKNSVTPGHVPSLAIGELGVNLADGNIYYTLDGTTISKFKPNEVVTQLPSDNSVQPASTAYVTTAVNVLSLALLDGVPAVLNTLNKIASALGDDANFAATMNAALTSRLRLDGPQGLTGTQQLQGANNLGVLLFTVAQTLTPTQKTQAQANLGLGTAALLNAATITDAKGGTSATTALTPAAAQAIIPMVEPGGRLTIQVGQPLMLANVTNATQIFYLPFRDSWVPIINRSTSLPYMVDVGNAGLTNILSDTTKNPAAAVASSYYDLFIWDDFGTIRLVRSPAWVNAATRSVALARVAGILVNAGAITNGPAPFVGTYVGSFFTNSSGTITWTWNSGGLTALLSVYNAYQQKRLIAVTNNPSNVDYGTAAWAAAGPSIAFVTGLPEWWEAQCDMSVWSPNSANTPFYAGIGLNSASPSAQQEVGPTGSATHYVSARLAANTQGGQGVLSTMFAGAFYLEILANYNALTLKLNM